eukprot:TRINITY_DN8052_c0_g2_i1.p1 TRINITY_DN8052_c0_g2~~TRINITY_DN8052_c0_g2_i1.p1  ORF type:complete len:189 (-),score=45.73 TRINITY_DN8052_c0_g2_i1:197-763(-)
MRDNVLMGAGVQQYAQMAAEDEANGVQENRRIALAEALSASKRGKAGLRSMRDNVLMGAGVQQYAQMAAEDEANGVHEEANQGAARTQAGFGQEEEASREEAALEKVVLSSIAGHEQMSRMQEQSSSASPLRPEVERGTSGAQCWTPPAHLHFFDPEALDTNGDGLIDRAEFIKYYNTLQSHHQEQHR